MICLYEYGKPIRLIRRNAKPKATELKSQETEVSEPEKAEPAASQPEELQSNEDTEEASEEECGYKPMSGHCTKTCITYRNGNPIASNEDKIQLVMFPCPVINYNCNIAPAFAVSHYGLVLPKKMIERIAKTIGNDYFKPHDGFLPAIMNTTTKDSRNPINTENSLPINLANYFSNAPGSSTNNVLPNLICSIQPGAYVVLYSFEKTDSEQLRNQVQKDLQDYLCQEEIKDPKAYSLKRLKNRIDISKIDSLQDLLILALSRSLRKQYIDYCVGQPGEEQFGEGAWTHGGPIEDTPYDSWVEARKDYVKNHNIQERIVLDSYFARGASALNECLSDNLEDGWLTVLLIA